VAKSGGYRVCRRSEIASERLPNLRFRLQGGPSRHEQATNSFTASRQRCRGVDLLVDRFVQSEGNPGEGERILEVRTIGEIAQSDQMG